VPVESRGHPFPIAAAAAALLLAGRPASTQTQTPPIPSIEAAIEEVAAHDARGEFEPALDLLAPLLARHPEHYELLCWQAELLVDLATYRSNSLSVEQQKAFCRDALTSARRAVEVNPGGAEGWFQRGQAAGALSNLPGGKETVEYCRETKTAFEQALACDPEHVWALHGLALWHREVACLPGPIRLAAKVLYGGLPRASNQEAIRLLTEAIRLNPGCIRHHLERGKTWLEMKEPDLARAEFERVLGLSLRSYHDEHMQAEARELLASLRASADVTCPERGT
jgi:tetratricopeptide (TPR) repeat protein